MNRFAFARAEIDRRGRRARLDLVAEAMVAPTARTEAGSSIVKAGGIDLLDLMKEGLLAPGQSRQPARHSRARRDRRDAPTAGLRIGAMATLARLAADPLVRASAIRRLPTRSAALGEPANPQCRDARRQSLAAAALLVFSLRGVSLPAQRRRTLLRDRRREPVSRDFRQPLLRDRPSLDRGDGARRARRHASSSSTLKAATREVAAGRFLRRPDRDVQRENDLEAGEILTAIALPPAGGPRMAHMKLAEKESFDWPLADVAVVLDLGAGRRLPSRLDRARRRRADPASRARRRGRADRPARSTTSARRRGRPRRARRRDAAARRTPTSSPLSRRWSRRAVLQAAGVRGSRSPVSCNFALLRL